ncbi:FAD-dependent oxidoreductase, partial [Deltaproteobacteria bacterium OttesenSCG-928-K17]|nr:FAD-dependent oxidoreductase [Deltaproteobacteria bacterium OttesenSCG-928-K17]
QIKRRQPGWTVEVFEIGERTSYAMCGMPYYIGGLIDSIDDLVVLTPRRFEEERGIKVHIRHQVTALNPAKKSITVQNLATGEKREENYDRLVLATGAEPVVPQGLSPDNPGVYYLRSLDEAVREDFLMGMFNIARQQADIVAAGLDLSGRARLLDLGGGPGTYAIYFCLRNPDLKAVIFDMPTTEKFARATIARFGLQDRVDFIGGDFLESELPKGFDAVWLSQVLHGEKPADAARLVARGASVLNPGGLLNVQEFILNDDRRGPAQPALFSLNMLVQTPGGQAYTEGEIKAMMEGAGLGDISRLQLDLPPGCGIMSGIKKR